MAAPALSWSNGLKATHYWDCNGQGCDATTLQPWDPSRFWSPPTYAPQDPGDHGGPAYGERLWMVGAASDALADLLGPSDGCCGYDNDSQGCGKCVLVRNPNAIHHNWTALVMKKNRCPPWSTGCQAPNVHMDMAVPGFDHPHHSTANICGPETGGWEEQPPNGDESHSSYTLGTWYNRHGDTAAAASAECDQLPPAWRPGCKRFGEWGWRTGDPYLQYTVVMCPPAFTAHVQSAFSSSGPTSATQGSRTSPTPPPSLPPLNDPPQPPAPPFHPPRPSCPPSSARPHWPLPAADRAYSPLAPLPPVPPWPPRPPPLPPTSPMPPTAPPGQPPPPSPSPPPPPPPPSPPLVYVTRVTLTAGALLGFAACTGLACALIIRLTRPAPRKAFRPMFKADGTISIRSDQC